MAEPKPEVRLADETIAYLREQVREAVVEGIQASMTQEAAQRFWSVGIDLLKVFRQLAAVAAAGFERAVALGREFENLHLQVRQADQHADLDLRHLPAGFIVAASKGFGSAAVQRPHRIEGDDDVLYGAVAVPAEFAEIAARHVPDQVVLRRVDHGRKQKARGRDRETAARPRGNISSSYPLSVNSTLFSFPILARTSARFNASSSALLPPSPRTGSLSAMNCSKGIGKNTYTEPLDAPHPQPMSLALPVCYR